MKTTMISLCAVAVMTGSAFAQQSTPVPASNSNPPVVAPQPPSSPVPTHDTTTTVEQRSQETTIENRTNNDVSEAVEPVAPPVNDDNRVNNQPTPVTPVPPVPNPEEQPRDTTTPVERQNDGVSNVEERPRDTSPDNYEPALNYDTDNDGILDTNEHLRGPINPEQPQQLPTP